MRIKSLKMTNFRQYYGEQKIDFGYSDDRNVTLILGENGEGKTGIFRAVIFCLFGQVFLSGEEHISRSKKNDEYPHLVNILKLEENIDEPVKTKVEVEFIHNKITYIISREIIEMKESNGDIIAEDESEVEMTIIDENGNTLPEKIIDEQEVQEKISDILDKKLKDFFFFDGEKIENLSKPTKQTRMEVKSGIIKLLQIEKVEEAIKVLLKLENKYKNKIINNTSNTKLQAKRCELEEINNEIEEINKNIDILDQEYLNCNEMINEYSEKLAQDENIRQKYNEIELLKKEKAKYNDELKYITNDARDLLKKQGSNLLFEDYLITIKNYLAQIEETNEYSFRISLDIIEDILTNKLCICGDKIEEGTDRYLKLEEIKNKCKKSELNNFLTYFKINVNSFYENKEDYNDKLKDLLSRISEKEDSINNIQRKIEQCNEDVKNYSSNKQNLDELEKILTEYKNNLFELENRKIQKQSQINFLKNKVKDLEKEIEFEEKQEKSLQNDVKRKEYIIRLKESFQSVFENYSMEMRQKIACEATDIFKKMISDKDFELVKNIDISESYEIKVEGWNGNYITFDVSAGQRQIISLAFVIALSKIASGNSDKTSVPLFIDTPFGRISGKNRDNLVSILPKLSEQLVLLMTDTEFTKAEERIFKSEKTINSVYSLSKIKNGYTKIIKIEDFETKQISRR